MERQRETANGFGTATGNGRVRLPFAFNSKLLSNNSASRCVLGRGCCVGGNSSYIFPVAQQIQLY